MRGRISLQAHQTPNKANAHAGDRKNHERKNQGITRDSAGKSSDPGYSGGNNRSNVCKDSLNSGRRACSLKHLHKRLYMYHPDKEPGHNKENRKGRKGRYRGSEKEVWKLSKEPDNEVHHVLRKNTPPRRNVQKIRRQKRPAAPHQV